MITVEDLIDCLSDIEDKSKPVYVTNTTTGLKSVDIDHIRIDAEVRLIIET